MFFPGRSGSRSADDSPVPLPRRQDAAPQRRRGIARCRPVRCGTGPGSDPRCPIQANETPSPPGRRTGCPRRSATDPRSWPCRCHRPGRSRRHNLSNMEQVGAQVSLRLPTWPDHAVAAQSAVALIVPNCRVERAVDVSMRHRAGRVAAEAGEGELRPEHVLRIVETAIADLLGNAGRRLGRWDGYGHAPSQRFRKITPNQTK